MSSGTRLSALLPDGSRDATFGSNGVVTPPFELSDFVSAHDGFIGSGEGMRVAFFARTGEVTHVTKPLDWIYGVEIAQDAHGRIVLSGTLSRNSHSNPDEAYEYAALGRLLPDGTLDTSFDEAGMRDYGSGSARGILSLRGGKYLIVGSDRDRWNGTFYRVWD